MSSPTANLRTLFISFTVVLGLGPLANANVSTCAGLFATGSTDVVNQILRSAFENVKKTDGRNSIKVQSLLTQSSREVVAPQIPPASIFKNNKAEQHDVKFQIEYGENGLERRLYMKRPGQDAPELLKTYLGGHAQLIKTSEGLFVFFGDSRFGRASVEHISVTGKEKHVEIQKTGEFPETANPLQVIGNFVLQISGGVLTVIHPTATEAHSIHMIQYFKEFSEARAMNLRVLQTLQNGDIEIEISGNIFQKAGPVYSQYIETQRLTNTYILRIQTAH